jgi:archaetidylinositol phosphate synthase
VLLKPTVGVGSSWTHQVARWAVRPLVDTRVTPNHLTTLRLVTGLVACFAFGIGERDGEIWGGVLWVVSAFLDRADGELARISGKTSPGGHAYDYACDVAVNALFFAAIGVGLRDTFLGWWAIPIGAVTALAILAGSLLSEALEKRDGSGKKAYSGVAGFDFDDVLYLFGPFAWLGWLLPLLLGAAIGGPAVALLTWWRYHRLLKAASG